MMDFYIVLHTTLRPGMGQGMGTGTNGFHTHFPVPSPIPCLVPVPGPVQCEQAITPGHGNNGCMCSFLAYTTRSKYMQPHFGSVSFDLGLLKTTDLLSL